MKVFDESGKLSSTPFTGEDVRRSGVQWGAGPSKATSVKADFSTTFTNLLKAGGGALQSLDSGDIVADERSARRHSAETAREKARAELADLDSTPFDGPQALWTHSVDAVKKGWDDMLTGKFL